MHSKAIKNEWTSNNVYLRKMGQKFAGLSINLSDDIRLNIPVDSVLFDIPVANNRNIIMFRFLE